MTFTQKDLNKKPETELAAIAEELGLSINLEAQSKNQIIDDILKAQEEDADFAEEEQLSEAEPIVKTEERRGRPRKDVQKKFRLTISNQDGVDQTDFVKVQVNGYMYTIPREVEVEVPEEVIEVLNNAVVTRYVQEGDVMVPRKARRFPFTVLGPAK